MAVNRRGRAEGERLPHAKPPSRQVDDGNRYQIASRAVDGEHALVAALREELAEWRRDKTAPKAYFLLVSIRVTVKPGVTATEDQIALAHRTVDLAGVQRPPELNVVVTISGTGDRGTRYAIAEQTHEGDDALEEAVRALAEQAEKSGKRLVVQLEVAPDAGAGAGAVDAATKTCLEAGAAVQAPAQPGR